MTVTVFPPSTRPAAARPAGSADRMKPQAQHDPWADWAPAYGRADSPQHRQETKAPTTVYRLRGGGAQDDGPRRRILDARLWDSLTAHEQDAALMIEAAFSAMTRGLGFAKSDPSRVPGNGGRATNTTELQGVQAARYMQWARACQIEKIDHAAVIDVVVMGESCRAVDRTRRQRAGSAKVNLVRALSLFCRQQGWPCRPA